MRRTTRGAVGVVVNAGPLATGLEQSLPVAFVGVAQVWVLGDGHITVADFFQRAKAQGGDADGGHNHALDATKMEEKSVGIIRVSNCCCRGNSSHVSPRLLIQGSVFTRHVLLSSSSNDLQIFKRTE